MQNQIIIEQLKYSEKGAALAFLGKAYADNPRQSDPHFWDWHFIDSPHVDPEGLPIWLAKSGDRIAGQLATLPVELNIGEKKVKALWVLDWIVDADFRRQGIGKKLAMAAEEYSPFLLGVNTDQQHAPALLLGLDWVVVTKIPRFHKILFPGNALREIAKFGPLKSIVNFVSAPLRPGFKKNFFEGSGLHLLDGFDSSFDTLWSECKTQWKCAVSRSSEMLDWQFKRQPGKKFDILGYFDDGKLLGYAVLFFRKADANGSIAKAAISDICYHPEKQRQIVDTLIHGALQICVERRVGGLVADAVDELLESRLKHFGFWKVNSPLQLMAKSPVDRELVYNPENWFLTRGDSDISIFEDFNL